jgi:tape measure domain-containing protein
VDAENRSAATFRSLEGQMGKTQGSVSSFAGTAAKLTAAFYAAQGAISAVSNVLSTGFNVAAQLETAEIGLTTLLGSADKARETVNRLKIESARTPFELPGLTQAAQLLTSVTKDGNKSIDVILDIGEGLAAMGKGQAELDRIIINLQQIAAVGKAATIDIKQFAFAGIPIYEMLAETTGKSGEALNAFIEDGGVTFDLLTKMFDEANDSGGRFFNAFVNQSGSFNQTLSNLKDSFGLFAADIVQNSGMFDGAIRGMQDLSWAFANYQTLATNVRDNTLGFFTMLDEKTGIITSLRDSWTRVATQFREDLLPALMRLWEAMQPYLPFLAELAKAIGWALAQAIKFTVDKLADMLVALMKVIEWATKLGAFFYETFAPAWEFIAEKVNAAIEPLQKFYNLAKKAFDLVGGLPGRIGKGISNVLSVDDAVISPSGKVITTHPEDYVIATKNPQSLFASSAGAVININGGTYLSEDAAEMLGDKILNRLKLSSAI